MKRGLKRGSKVLPNPFQSLFETGHSQCSLEDTDLDPAIFARTYGVSQLAGSSGRRCSVLAAPVRKLHISEIRNIPSSENSGSLRIPVFLLLVLYSHNFAGGGRRSGGIYSLLWWPRKLVSLANLEIAEEEGISGSLIFLSGRGGCLVVRLEVIFFQ